MCQVLDVSKSGYYSWLKRKSSKQKIRKTALTAKITRIHVESRKIYGSPKITEILQQKGETVSQKTVSNIMKENNLRSKTVKKYKATTNSHHKLPVYPN
jgi:putative transposase